MNKKLLILDLDETLIYATEQQLGHEADFQFFSYHVYLRPHVREFIAFCLEHFECAVWTSASEDYAAIIVRHLFGEEPPLKFIWARQRCTRVFNPEYQDFEWVKNLQKVKRRGYRLEHIIMLDDTPKKLRRNYGNLVRINMFEGDMQDRELKHVMLYLQELKLAENIRKIEKRGWRLRFTGDPQQA
ncbi:NIF family HAD-type phosphatase [Undibacterium umbellatum]|uniref:HAD family hydrolase n=1 Tax=Undibacterium umbellatum TaxID=2762300 RepID=A0ABR6ZG15_9BURK|nr:HAD family hydrolase [Undibacterium umbellatum]MBC3910673.1 HAD family hydrolase [Undibacterium umbellatum]